MLVYKREVSTLAARWGGVLSSLVIISSKTLVSEKRG